MTVVYLLRSATPPPHFLPQSPAVPTKAWSHKEVVLYEIPTEPGEKKGKPWLCFCDFDALWSAEMQFSSGSLFCMYRCFWAPASCLQSPVC